MRVVVTDYVEPDLGWETEQLAAHDITLEVHQLKHAPPEAIAAAVAGADVVVVNMARIDAAVAATGLDRCRLVIRHGVGYDNVDVGALAARGIHLANVPDYCVDEVAEQAIALCFALARHVVRSRGVLEASSRARQWDFSPLPPLHRLRGRTFGIVGFGRIGSRLFEKLSGFGFTWLVCDPYLAPHRRPPAPVEMVDLATLLERADIVSLHAPLNDETFHFIDGPALARMKPTAFLVNTARGGLVDHVALREALAARRLGGAGLDVFEVEPPDPDDPLLTADNVVLTPHLAWSSEEAAWDIRRKIVAAILDFQAGRPAKNLIAPGPAPARRPAAVPEAAVAPGGRQ